MFKQEIKNISELEKELKSQHQFIIKHKLETLLRISKKESVSQVAKDSGLTRRPIYNWIKAWNEHGIEGLKPIPHLGRPSKLSDTNLSKLKVILEKVVFFTTAEAKKIIKEEFNIDFSLYWTSKILKNKLGFRFSKPYLMDKRKPSNADEILKQNIEKTVIELQKQNINPKDVAIGFIDESSHQNRSNTARLWHSKNHNILKKDMTKLQCSTIGFYAIRGNSTLSIIESSKKEELSKFLQEIADANFSYNHIIAIIDNFKTHHSDYFVKEAERQGIHLIYLPPYSPDINPIEFIWKDLKRIISEKCLSVNNIAKTIYDYFMDISKSLSYANSWIKEFMPCFLVSQ